MSSDLLRRAAVKLRDPLLCNFDRTLALALADLLDDLAASGFRFGPDAHALTVARAVLREDGEQR